jgi:broad specificity phosphatase PhoE
MNNSVFSLKHPKAAAYIFAGQAFGTATVLVACSGFTLAMLLSMMMDVRNLEEFHIKMTNWAQTTFPDLHASKDYEDDNSHLELVKEWIAALDEPLSESEHAQQISKRLKRGLGLD